ncbi:MAG: hypothetical protein E6G46_10365 [Actinobacteria bacterium]|nr:MAG: hypothetical protein E6G46_10365 [Actinomycetota bacterium]
MRRHLTPIIGVSKTLLTHGSKLGDAQRAECVKITLRNALQLEHLIHEMIDLQRFDAAGWIIQRRPTDVRALIDALVPELDVGNRPLRVDGDGPIVNIDPGLLERIIDNLVQNAKAYTPPGSPIIIATQSDGTGAHITVQDSAGGARQGQGCDLRRLPFRPRRRKWTRLVAREEVLRDPRRPRMGRGRSRGRRSLLRALTRSRGCAGRAPEALETKYRRGGPT